MLTKEEDLIRINKLTELKIDPFVMPYKSYSGESDLELSKKCGFSSVKEYKRYLKDFARWVNHKAIFRTVSFDDYIQVRTARQHDSDIQGKFRR